MLFVEDDEHIRKETSELLEDIFQKNITIAVDGQDGFTKYMKYFEENNKHFDLIITDICMPKIDGVELTKLIKKENIEQKLIVLSAHNESEYLMELVNVGISQFILKPIEFNSFIDIIYKILWETDDLIELNYWVSRSEPLLIKQKNDSLARAFHYIEGSRRLAFLDYELGMKLLQETLLDAEKAKDSINISQINYRLGTHYYYLDQGELGLRYLEKSLITSPSYGDSTKKSNVMMSVGTLQCLFGNFEEGVKNQLAAMELKKQLNAWNSIPISLSNLAGVYMSTGENDRALELTERSIFLSDSCSILSIFDIPFRPILTKGMER